MKKNLIYLLLIVAVSFASCTKENEIEATIVLNLENKLTEAETEWTGDTSGELDDAGYYNNSFNDGFFKFNNFNNPEWFIWGGFAYTNKSDVTTGDYTNNSAITGKAKTGSVYLTVNSNDFTPAKLSFVSNELTLLKGMYITNATYAYKVIKEGNDFTKAFESGDWFKLSIIGYDDASQKTGSVDYYLADYRDGKSFILNEWEWIDLAPLGYVNSVKFEMTSSDVGEWGMNTPAYFCIDDITAIKK